MYNSLSMGNMIKIAAKKHTKTMPDGKKVDINALEKALKNRVTEMVDVEGLNTSTSSRSGYKQERYENVDMTKPVIIDKDGWLVDGRHRVLRHKANGTKQIKARRATQADLQNAII
jgi:hypothetical protein